MNQVDRHKMANNRVVRWLFLPYTLIFEGLIERDGKLSLEDKVLYGILVSILYPLFLLITITFYISMIIGDKEIQNEIKHEQTLRNQAPDTYEGIRMP